MTKRVRCACRQGKALTAAAFWGRMAYQRLRAVDRRVRHALRRRGPGLLRVALGVVFLWFGLLKVFGASPVADLVEATLSWLPPRTAVVLVGAVETVLGLGLIAGVAVRLVVTLLGLHLLGTFAPLFLFPHVAFEGGDPWRLTVEGEFIVKNLVLLAAGLVVAGHAPGLPVPESADRAD